MCNNCRKTWLSKSFLDVLGISKQLYDRKMHGAKQWSIVSYFKPSILTTADDKPQTLILGDGGVGIC